MNTVVTTHFERPTRTAVAGISVQHPPLSRLHPGALALTAGGYVAMIAVLWLGFATPTDHYLPLVIFTFVLAFFIGVPWMMAQSAKAFWRRHDGPAEPRRTTFREYLHRKVETGAGTVTGSESLVLMALIPISLTVALIAMAVIMHAVQ